MLDVVSEAEGVRAAELRALSRQQRSLREDGVEVQHLEHHRGLVGQVARAAEDVEQVAADAVGLHALEAVREGEGEARPLVADDHRVGRGAHGGEERSEGERGAAQGSWLP